MTRQAAVFRVSNGDGVLDDAVFQDFVQETEGRYTLFVDHYTFEQTLDMFSLKLGREATERTVLLPRHYVRLIVDLSMRDFEKLGFVSQTEMDRRGFLRSWMEAGVTTALAGVA